MPVSSEPFYGGSLIQGVGSFHNTDLARLHKNRRRLSPVQRRIVDLASMKKYSTPDSLYNALYQATQHPHLTAELVPKPLQANPATFLIASEGPDTLRGLVDGHSDPPRGGPSGPRGGKRGPGGGPGGRPGGGGSPGLSSTTTQEPTSSEAQTQDPVTSQAQTDEPSTSEAQTQDPVTGDHRTQTDDVPTTSRAAQEPTDDVTGKRQRQDDPADPTRGYESAAKRRRLGEPSSEDLPLRRGRSSVPPWARHRRDVNVRRYTQGVTLQSQRVAANYMTSLMHTSVNALPQLSLVSGMLVHNGGHGRLERVVRQMTDSMPAWAVDSLFHGFLGVSEGLAAPDQIVPRMEDLQETVRSYLRPDENVYTLGQLWREVSDAMRQGEEPEGLRQVSSLVNDGRVGRETFNMIQNAATEPRSMFAFTGADIANFGAVSNMPQDRLRRELPLATSRFLVEGEAAFGNALDSRTAHTDGHALYTRLNREDTATEGIHEWMRRYYRAITGSEAVQTEAPAYEQGLEARRNYVRDSMASVLGLAGTAFLARSVFRYANEGAPANPEGFDEPDQRNLDAHRGQWSQVYRPVYRGVDWNGQRYSYMDETESITPPNEAFQNRPQQPVVQQNGQRPADDMALFRRAQAALAAHDRAQREGRNVAQVNDSPIMDRVIRFIRAANRGEDPGMIPLIDLRQTTRALERGEREAQLAPIDEDEELVQDQQQGLEDDPRTPRRRVVDEVLEPINRIVRNYDRAAVLQDPNRRNTRQEAVRHAVNTGLLTLNQMAPDEWHYLRGRLQALREEQPPAAYDRRRPNAPYSMFTLRDLANDDVEAPNDAAEALGGDSRMRGPGLGFQPGEGNWRGRTRQARTEDSVIALTETPNE